MLEHGVFLNPRDGSVAPGTPYTTASSPNSISDGSADIAVAAGSVWVLLGAAGGEP